MKPELELTVQGVSINVSCTHLMETKQGKYDAAAGDLPSIILLYVPKAPFSAQLSVMFLFHLHEKQLTPWSKALVKPRPMRL